MTDHIPTPAQPVIEILEEARSGLEAYAADAAPQTIAKINAALRALASQPPAAPCNAAGNRYPSDEEAEWAINGAHDFAETLRSKPVAPVETDSGYDELFDIEEGFDAGEWNNLPETEPCKVCGGSGFSGRGTGYDDVCGECGGLKCLPVSRSSAETEGVAKMQATGRTKAGNDIGGI